MNFYDDERRLIKQKNFVLYWKNLFTMLNITLTLKRQHSMLNLVLYLCSTNFVLKPSNSVFWKHPVLKLAVLQAPKYVVLKDEPQFFWLFAESYIVVLSNKLFPFFLIRFSIFEKIKFSQQQFNKVTNKTDLLIFSRTWTRRIKMSSTAALEGAHSNTCGCGWSCARFLL